MTTLGFGKWADTPIADVPEDYLQWLIKNSQDKIDICKVELERRAAPFNDSWMTKIVNAGHENLVLNGLSNDDLNLVNRARLALLAAIKDAATAKESKQ